MGLKDLDKALDNAIKMIGSYGAIRIDNSNTIKIGKYNIPTVYAGNQLISGDFTIVDQIKKNLGYLCSFSYIIPEGLVRISTNLKDSAGKGVLGTIIDNSHSLCISIKNGTKVLGREWLINDFCETVDIPLYDENKKLVMSFGLGHKENSGQREVVIFSLAGQIYAMNIMFIREIIHLPDNIFGASGENKNILGLFSLREEIIPIIDTLKVFGHESINYFMLKSKEKKMIIIQIENKKHGIIIDRVFGLGKYEFKDLERIRISDTDLAKLNLIDGILPEIKSFANVPIILGDRIVQIASTI